MKYIVTTLIIVYIFLTGSYLSQNRTPEYRQLPTPTITTSQEVAGVTDKATSPTNIPHISSAPTINHDREVVRVLKVVDGDTIHISGNRTLRYIGIDTPESVDPRRPAQCFGKEAAEKNRELVEGKYVSLEKDVSETDKYGRLLRYVYLGDILINEQLVIDGFAHASSYPPDVKYDEQLHVAEQQARHMGAGLWQSCQTETRTPRSGGSGVSSEDKDCSDFTSQSEAQSYFDINGGSSTNNVDRLDGSDGDGQVCETLP